MISHLQQPGTDLLISFPILSKLFFPEQTVGFGKHKILTTLMGMPKTSIDKNDSVILGKYNIGFPHQTLVIDPESESMTKQVTSHQELAPGVLRLDTCHDLAALGKGKTITHR
jgi:hypothetical protein